MSAILQIQNANDPAIREYARALRGARKQQRKWEASDRHIARVFGLSAEDWARLFEAQAGKCVGCLTALKMDKRTHVDHCHRTGRVRGLLCAGCNSALGQIRDNTETLRRLITYLEG